jgi:hypothetical protein
MTSTSRAKFAPEKDMRAEPLSSRTFDGDRLLSWPNGYDLSLKRMMQISNCGIAISAKYS